MRGLRRLISVDIGSRLIKIAQVTQSSGKARLDRVGVTENPASGDRNLEKKESRNAVVQAIRESMKENHISVKDVASSLSGSSIIVQYFKFPTLSGKELENAVMLEAQRMMSARINDMETDFLVLPPERKGASEQEILFAAVPREIVQRRMDILQHAGLNPIVIDLDSLALANSYLTLKKTIPGEHTMLLNLGARSINLGIVGNDILHFIRDISLSIKESADFQEKNVLDTAFNEIDKSIHYYEARAKGGKVTRAFLTGGGSVTPEVCNVFSEALHIPVERWNPLEDMEFDSRKIDGKFSETDGYLLAVALGLGLREY